MPRWILLRSLVFHGLLIGSVMVVVILLVLVSPFGLEGTKDRLARAWAYFNLVALKWICGLDYRIHGLERLPRQDDTVIVLAKHQSAWETIALRAILPLRQSWVLKQELMRIPIFSTGLKQFSPIPINRSAGRRAILELVREGLERLERGRWVIIFPEGTRVAPGTRHTYAMGGATLGAKSGRRIIPIAHNAGVFWARRSVRKRPGVIDLVIGEPIETAGRSAPQINSEVEDWIETTVAALPGCHSERTADRAASPLASEKQS
ncbi:1-acyl-sn-glycerol-3-phosphate acyltransferase [Thiocapsa imhoffii]|uniref:1-acyl-sn-glycerol-3-phosphate acyltransferase n=1 Tax=Thiocapsa imhoffii TaxID=382777 RepID=A0A9X1B8K7_9GAMM|nr:lysophospholipid acyltransferase family protein [Thiocapsa imhoffii]MBK1645019.1 1-acyl-sn-glycerol-3-phosphate acyltransferase [Thiocapsa imhoffii]